MNNPKEQSLFSPEEYKANFKKNKAGKAEENIQIEVCNYIRNTYPGVIFFCDLASGMKLPIWIASRNAKMRSSRGLPDLFIAKSSYAGPAHTPGLATLFYGLFIELKKDSVTIRLKNGELTSNEHIREQEAILQKLRGQGYRAEFACGYQEAVNLIDEYLK